MMLVKKGECMINRRIFSLISSAVVLGLVGCAPTKQFVPLPDQNVQIEDTTKARIYVLRPTTFGSAVNMKITDGNISIGLTGPNGYLCWERDAENTIISGKSENTSSLPIVAEKGKSYFINQEIQLGLIIARNKLTLLEEKKGKMLLMKCKKPILVKDSINSK
jgi:hypothetical protein